MPISTILTSTGWSPTLYDSINRGLPGATGVMYAFGDSIALGTGVGSTANRFSSLVAAAMGWTETNVALSGTSSLRWVSDAMASRPLAAGDRVLVMPGFNDARFSGATAANATQYATSLTGMLCYLGVPDSSRVFSQNAAGALNTAQAAFVGTWVTSPTWAGGLATSRCGAYSGTSGDYFQTTVTGDTVHVMLGGFSTLSSAVRVTIDGVTPVAGSIAPQALVGLPEGSNVWQPVCMRFGGLSPGQHVVRVTLTASVNALVPYVAAFNASDVGKPVVVVCSNTRMTAAGYAVAPANATDTVMREYQRITRETCQSLGDEGLLVRYVDVDSDWTPNALSVAGDNVHPNEQTHQLWARRILAALR